jgi:hypothetical protein
VIVLVMVVVMVMVVGVVMEMVMMVLHNTHKQYTKQHSIPLHDTTQHNAAVL